MTKVIYIFSFILLSASLPQNIQATISAAKTCSDSLKKLKRLHAVTEQETILEAMALLTMMTKNNIKDRIVQIPQDVLEKSLEKLQRTLQKLEAYQNDEETPLAIKNAITPDIVSRTNYLVNKIQETLKEYERGARGNSHSPLGHAGSNKKKRTLDSLPSQENKKLSKKMRSKSSLPPTPHCQKVALDACNTTEGNGNYTQAARVTLNSEFNSDFSDGAPLTLYPSTPNAEKYAVDPNHSTQLQEGQIVCIKKITAKTKGRWRYVFAKPLPDRCS